MWSKVLFAYFLLTVLTVVRTVLCLYYGIMKNLEATLRDSSSQNQKCRFTCPTINPSILFWCKNAGIIFFLNQWPGRSVHLTTITKAANSSVEEDAINIYILLSQAQASRSKVDTCFLLCSKTLGSSRKRIFCMQNCVWIILSKKFFTLCTITDFVINKADTSNHHSQQLVN